MITFHTAKNVHAINVFLGSDVRHESQFPSDVDREEWEEEQKVMRTVKSPQTFVWPGGDTNFHFPTRIMSIKSETLQSLIFFFFST